MNENPPAGATGAPRARRSFLGGIVRAALVVMGMGFMAVLGGYVILMLTVRGSDVVVPDLTRMTKEDAEAEAGRSRLRVEVAGTRIEPRVAEGQVFEQDPPAGSRIRPLRSVKIYLSAGQETLEVPGLTGAPLRKAQLSLQQMGLRIGDLARVPSLDLPPDQVIAQSPAPGARRHKGDTVSLLVSRGPPERVYVMPSLLGLSAQSASTILQDVGVRVGLSQRESTDGDALGVVLAQHPAEGHPVRERETARLVVSR